MEFATRAIHHGLEDTPAGDVTPPIHLTSIYAMEEAGVTKGGYEYIRFGNPTRTALEECLASLEQAPADCPAICFSSGQAAIDCALRLLRPGDHIIIPLDVYGGTVYIAEDILRPMEIEVTYADATDTEAYLEAFQPNTKMVWLESPSNPLLRITDVPAIVEAAHERDILVAMDSSFGTPYFQNPLLWGVDIVMHSMTKYLGGHSDLLGGVLLLRDPALRKRLYTLQKITGAVAAPFDCWLVLRGIRTLAARMKIHQSNALHVASCLEAHPNILRVHYPGLTSHPHHERAKTLMRGFGGVLSFEVKGEADFAAKVMRRVQLFHLAPSLGGVESIMSYPAQMSHKLVPRADRYARGITDGLIRISCGLEDVQDLLADLEQALCPI